MLVLGLSDIKVKTLGTEPFYFRRGATESMKNIIKQNPQD
jgi:hypothetical protein